MSDETLRAALNRLRTRVKLIHPPVNITDSAPESWRRRVLDLIDEERDAALAATPAKAEGPWKYDSLCEVTDETHAAGEACQPLEPHSHRAGKIKWARRLDGPVRYAGPHDDCIATVPHLHDHPYRPGDWSATPSEPASLCADCGHDHGGYTVCYYAPMMPGDGPCGCTTDPRPAATPPPPLDVEALREAIHRVWCDRPQGYAKHAAGNGVRCGVPLDSEAYPIAAEYARLATGEPDDPQRRTL